MAQLQLQRLQITLQDRWMSRKLWFGAVSLLVLVLLGVFHVHGIAWDDLLNAIVAVVGITIGSMSVTDVAEHWAAVRQAGFDAQSPSVSIPEITEPPAGMVEGE